MWNRFVIIGICAIFVLSLGTTFIMTQGQTGDSCSTYAAEVDSGDSEDALAEDALAGIAKRQSFCLGIPIWHCGPKPIPCGWMCIGWWI